MDYWGRCVTFRLHKNHFVLDITKAGFGGAHYHYLKLIINTNKPKKYMPRMLFLTLFNKEVVKYYKEVEETKLS